MSDLTVSVQNGICHLVISRPAKRNTIDAATCLSWVKVLAQAQKDDAVRCVIISGEETVFCAGADLQESLHRDVFDSNDNWVNERAKTFSNEIQRSTQDYIEQGKAENAFSEERKSKISINESNMYWNYDRHRRLSSVYAYHTWLSERDDRVRPTHITADGQRVPVNEPFWVGGYRMMYPTDSSLGAGPEEIVNCRCVEIFS